MWAFQTSSMWAFRISRRYYAGDRSEAAAKIKAVEAAMLKSVGPPSGPGRFGSSKDAAAATSQKKIDRQALMQQTDAIQACQAKVGVLPWVEVECSC
jgi:hypothetical protein